MIGGIVLAAGAGRRFGAAKQLAQLDGRPLLEHALIAMAAAPALGSGVVVLGCDADRVLATTALHGVRPVISEQWRDGQAASLRAGLAALREQADGELQAVVVTLGDQPRIDPRAIESVVGARGPDADAVRATYAGRAGHPVLLERGLFDSVAALRGDSGARDLLSQPGVRLTLVACDGLGRPDDVDTPEQLRRLSG